MCEPIGGATSGGIEPPLGGIAMDFARPGNGFWTQDASGGSISQKAMRRQGPLFRFAFCQILSGGLGGEAPPITEEEAEADDERKGLA